MGAKAQKHAGREYTAHHIGANLTAIPLLRPPDDVLAQQLRAISPFYPPGLRLQIQTTSQPTPQQFEEWTNQADQDPVALTHLGDAYTRIDDKSNATQMYKRAIERGAGQRAYFSLSQLYYRDRDYENWEQLLTDFLEKPSYGLSHANAQVLLARGLMERQEWARAKPYAAVAASDAWSGAALRCISNCLEGLGEHEESELWAQRLSQSYPNSAGAAWYFWLQRNGKPMDGKARQLADHYFGNRNAPPGRHKRLVFHFIVEEDYNRAINVLRLTKLAGLDLDLCYALIAYRTNDQEKIAIAQNMLNAWENWPLATEQEKLMAALMRNCLAKDAQTTPSAEDLAKLRDETTTAYEKVDFNYFLGEIFAMSGQMDQARTCWQLAEKQGPFDSETCTLAGFRLSQTTE